MNLELVILDGPQAGRRLPVSSAPRTIGRSSSSEMAFPEDNFISGVHLSVQADPVGVLVTDMRSTNGTFLNGERITQAVAEIGDVLQIGTLSLQVAAAKAEDQAVPSGLGAPLFSDGPTDPPQRGPAASAAATLPPMNIPAPPVGSATTTIPRIFVAPPPPLLSALPATKNTEPEPPHKQVLALLGAERIPLFALVNASAEEALSSWLEMSGLNLRQHSLWQGDPGSPLPAWAPFLLPLTPGSPLLQQLLENGWGKGWASYLTSAAPFEELRGHYGKFVMTQMQSRGEVYFPFYDPAVMRGFLPQASAGELAMFFGPVNEWFLEGDSKSALLRARNSPGGLLMSTVRMDGFPGEHPLPGATQPKPF